MKKGILVFFALILMACSHKEPDQVDVRKIFMCSLNKKSDVCSSLNKTEEKALSCLTNSGEFSKKECDEIKLNKGPAKSPDIQFHLRPGTDNK
jgi:hypothetical protein